MKGLAGQAHGVLLRAVEGGGTEAAGDDSAAATAATATSAAVATAAAATAATAVAATATATATARTAMGNCRETEGKDIGNLAQKTSSIIIRMYFF